MFSENFMFLRSFVLELGTLKAKIDFFKNRFSLIFILFFRRLLKTIGNFEFLPPKYTFPLKMILKMKI